MLEMQSVGLLYEKLMSEGKDSLAVKHLSSKNRDLSLSHSTCEEARSGGNHLWRWRQ